MIYKPKGSDFNSLGAGGVVIATLWNYWIGYREPNDTENQWVLIPNMRDAESALDRFFVAYEKVFVGPIPEIYWVGVIRQGWEPPDDHSR